MANKQPGLRAKVLKLVRGRRGTYAVAVLDGMDDGKKTIEGSLTFSLSKHVWRGKRRPAPDDVVVLYQLKQGLRGFRAMQARPFEMPDMFQSD